MEKYFKPEIVATNYGIANGCGKGGVTEVKNVYNFRPFFNKILFWKFE